VLLDLRDSSGGDPQEGLRLANFFVKQGTLATLEGQKFPRQTFSADPAKFLTDAPLAVLVNRGTAGPAELTAAAIEDLKRGDVVGERTFGQGSVQKTIELPGGDALLLTVAKYETPGGKKIPDEAVTPSVLVGPALEEEFDEEPPVKGDAPLDKALKLLKANNGNQAAQPAVEAVPAAISSATPPTNPPAAKSKPGFFRRLFGAK
jgi:carboxyl-terminal processing protease